MDAYVFVLIMHTTIGTHAPADVALSAWDTNERCLVAAGLFAEDDQRIQPSMGITYSCKRVPFNTPATRK